MEAFSKMSKLHKKFTDQVKFDQIAEVELALL